MVIVRFMGSLGNQLFQYALYRKLEYLGRDVGADIGEYKKGIEHRYFYLDKLGISVIEKSQAEINKICPDNRLLYIINRMKGLAQRYSEKKSYVYDKRVLDVDNTYLDGYWQCPLYFDDIKREIIDSISFPHLPNEQEIIKNQMQHEESVFIHVRRGDYLLFDDKYGGICTKEYYNNSIDYIIGKISNPIFYGFSDDIDGAKEFIDREDINWVSYNSEINAYNDLSLMINCKNGIMANSSFSWWAAYLMRDKTGVVIAPQKWINNGNACEIWCDSWIRM